MKLEDLFFLKYPDLVILYVVSYWGLLGVALLRVIQVSFLKILNDSINKNAGKLKSCMFLS